MTMPVDAVASRFADAGSIPAASSIKRVTNMVYALYFYLPTNPPINN